MRAFLAILKREFLAYFVSPLAYVVLTAFLLVNGVVFWLILLFLNSPDAPRNAFMSLFFTSVFYWIFMILVSSIISMRLLSEERKSGSIEALLTAPVSEATVVLGKFAGGWCFFMFLWLPTVLYPLLLARYGALDWGPVAAGYLGIALIGALFISAGTFASALTKNQIVAAVLAFLIILGIFMVGMFKDAPVGNPALRDLFVYLSVLEHMEDFGRGIVDTRRLVYMLSSAAFFLFLSTRALHANKGK
jgi:ABC-2 type transport system permease protein